MECGAAHEQLSELAPVHGAVAILVRGAEGARQRRVVVSARVQLLGRRLHLAPGTARSSGRGVDVSPRVACILTSSHTVGGRKARSPHTWHHIIASHAEPAAAVACVLQITSSLQSLSMGSPYKGCRRANQSTARVQYSGYNREVSVDILLLAGTLQTKI